jgi:hypothetical protein
MTPHYKMQWLPEGAGRRSKMPKLTLLDPTKTGKRASVGNGKPRCIEAA